jgi:hypothetical protein
LTVITENTGVQFLKSGVYPSNLLRWALAVQEFHFTAQHRAGLLHSNVDALSRNLVEEILDEEGIMTIECMQDMQEVYTSLLERSMLMVGNDWKEDLLEEQSNEVLDSQEEQWKEIQTDESGRIRLPQSWVPRILHHLHEEFGHAGINKMKKLLLKRFTWKNWRRDVTSHVETFQRCLEVKSGLRQSGKMVREREKPVVNLSEKFKDICMDLKHFSANPSKEGFDKVTLWVEIQPLRTKSAPEVARAFFKLWLCWVGVPSTITSDQGKEFKNTLLES